MPLPNAPKFRFYIDEVGNPDLQASNLQNHRYLSLTGVILDLDYVEQVLYRELEELKRKYFGSHPDDPVVLHRKELVNRRSPFEALRDPEVERSFNAEFLGYLRKWQYTVLTVVIDKLHQVEQYHTWRYDPYHYCLKVLVERFVQWMEKRDAVGDVMAESRGGREDLRLKKSFLRVYEEGSEWVSPERFHDRLTSRELKVKPKANNISGLQLADILAHCSYTASLARHQGQDLPATFGGQIALILEEAKYDKSPSGRIEGWGRKWLP